MLLQAAHNYVERGLIVYLLTAKLDNRDGVGKISSRIGLSKDAATFAGGDDLYMKLADYVAAESACACVFVDEAQFLTKEQVWQLARFVDDYGLPVMCYGLRVDFRGDLFPGSAALLALADEMREVRTICWCGKKAGMVVRRGVDGKAARDGAQVQIGGNDVYVSLCRRHWRAEVGDVPPQLQATKRQPACSPCTPAKAVADIDDDGEGALATAPILGTPRPSGEPVHAGGADELGGVESPK